MAMKMPMGPGMPGMMTGIGGGPSPIKAPAAPRPPMMRKPPTGGGKPGGGKHTPRKKVR